MGREVDPSDIGKHPELIRKAQTEMTKTDVLVCGGCNDVFHFMEQFSEHKDGNCTGTSTLKDSCETKPKVWAFLLWKASQLHQDNETTIVNPWKLYQTWLTLDEAIRETWVVAGRTIQSFARDNDEGGTINLDGNPTDQTQYVIKQDTSELNDPTQQLSIATDNDSQDGQITAEVVQADLPSPGGTRRVVLLLPDGNFMMTEVSDEQYQALNLVT